MGSVRRNRDGVVITNQYLLEHLKDIKKAAESCGVHYVGTNEISNVNNTDCITIGISRYYKDDAAELVADMVKMLSDLIPDNKFYVYPAGDTDLRMHSTIIYDGDICV